MTIPSEIIGKPDWPIVPRENFSLPILQTLAWGMAGGGVRMYFENFNNRGIFSLYHG